jgi:predicted AAA+ superfamily ATPase
MEAILELSESRILSVSMEYKRYLLKKIPQKQRLVFISGARGTGKTTLLLQYLKGKDRSSDNAAYISLDDIIFSRIAPEDFIDWFYKHGGEMIVIDEAHRYPGWSRVIKSAYDRYPKLRIIVTGSSALMLGMGGTDLSRRVLHLALNELSLREFAELKYGLSFNHYPLKDILIDHKRISGKISAKTKPLKIFDEYLEHGAYPFFKEGEQFYHSRLALAVNSILDIDLPALTNITYGTIIKIRKLLAVISETAPFTPNILELSSKVGVSRDLMYKYLDMLEKAGLIYLLRRNARGNSIMAKPEKIYLRNPNLSFALTLNQTNKGTQRETFFINQMSVSHKVTYPDSADFTIDGKFIFEIGGKSKSADQIKRIQSSFIVKDDIEYGSGNIIPLWLFGFTY